MYGNSKVQYNKFTRLYYLITVEQPPLTGLLLIMKINWAYNFFINENIDTEKILLQKHISIDEKINAGELREKLKLLGPNLVFETIIGVYNDKIIPLNQDKDDNIKKAPKFDKKNTIIQWKKSVIQVYNRG